MVRTQDDIQEELLVLQYQGGDREALRALVGRWQPRLVRLAWRLTLKREAARDIVQDTWLSIVRGLNRLDDPARFRMWAYRIVRNKCADWTRRRAVQREAVVHLCDEAGANARERSSQADPGDEVARLREALSGLAVEQRAILSLYYLDGMCIMEIARVLGVPRGTVKSRLYHARGRLRADLERTET